MANGSSVVLGTGTMVQLGTLATVLCAVAGGTLWLARTDNRLSNLEKDVAEIVKRFDGNLSAQTFELWAQLLGARNPELIVPPLPPRSAR